VGFTNWNFPRSWTENYGFDQPTTNLTMNNEFLKFLFNCINYKNLKKKYIPSHRPFIFHNSLHLPSFLSPMLMLSFEEKL
jgi:hypothetical protein